MAEKAINPHPFTIEIMDTTGKNHVLTGRTVARKQVKEFRDKVYKEAAKQPVEDQSTFQAAYIFEKPMEYFDDIEQRMINYAVKRYLEDLTDPQI